MSIPRDVQEFLDEYPGAVNDPSAKGTFSLAIVDWLTCLS
jgi:hypothetical protein